MSRLTTTLVLAVMVAGCSRPSNSLTSSQPTSAPEADGDGSGKLELKPRAEMEKANRDAEAKAVEFVELLGGKVKRDDEKIGKPVVEVLLFESKVTDAGLKELAPLKSLRDGFKTASGRCV